MTRPALERLAKGATSDLIAKMQDVSDLIEDRKELHLFAGHCLRHAALICAWVVVIEQHDTDKPVDPEAMTGLLDSLFRQARKDLDLRPQELNNDRYE